MNTNKQISVTKKSKAGSQSSDDITVSRETLKEYTMTKTYFISIAKESGTNYAVRSALFAGVRLAQIQIWILTKPQTAV